MTSRAMRALLLVIPAVLLSLPLVLSEPEGHDDDLLGKKLFPRFPANCKCLVAETVLSHRHHRPDG